MKLTSTERGREWRKRLRKTGLCMWAAYCGKPRDGGYYCRQHRKMFSAQQNARRDLRRQLGFCTYCKARALPGSPRCETHRKRAALTRQRFREKQAKARGWRMVRVKI